MCLSGIVVADTDELDSVETEMEATERPIDDAAAGSANSTKPDAAEETLPPTEEKAVPRAKKISKPFEPTERIEAESVISFPSNI
jgi:hypothetical protein